MKLKKNPAIVFEKPKKVIIQDIGMPTVGKEDLLIRTSRTLISTGTEITVLNGEFPDNSAWSDYGKFPFHPGYDNIGVVVETGKGVDKKWIGRKVATYGAHSRYVAMPFSKARVIHRDIPDGQAVFFTISEIVMNGIRRGTVQWGESVAVYGLGLLGQMAVRFCRLCGARPVIAIDTAPERLAHLPKDPGIIPVNPLKENLKEIAMDATRGRQVDVAIELTGKPDLIPGEIGILRPLGRFVVLSSPQNKTVFDFHDLCNARSYTIIGAHNMSHPPEATPLCPWSNLRHAEIFFDLIADGEIDVAPLISHRASYTEAPKLYDVLMRDRSKAMGIVLNWDGE